MNPLEYRGNYIATSNNEVGTLAVDGWAIGLYSQTTDTDDLHFLVYQLPPVHGAAMAYVAGLAICPFVVFLLGLSSLTL